MKNTVSRVLTIALCMIMCLMFAACAAKPSGPSIRAIYAAGTSVAEEIDISAMYPGVVMQNITMPSLIEETISESATIEHKFMSVFDQFTRKQLVFCKNMV